MAKDKRTPAEHIAEFRALVAIYNAMNSKERQTVLDKLPTEGPVLPNEWMEAIRGVRG